MINNLVLFIPDMRIVTLGPGGAIVDIDWFLNYRDTKLVVQVPE